MDKRVVLQKEVASWLVENKPSSAEGVRVRFIEHPGKGYRRVEGRIDLLKEGSYEIIVSLWHASTHEPSSDRDVWETVKHELKHIAHYEKHKALYKYWGEYLPAPESFLRVEMSKGRLSSLDVGRILEHLYDRWTISPEEGWELIKRVLRDMDRHLDKRVEQNVGRYLKKQEFIDIVKGGN